MASTSSWSWWGSGASAGTQEFDRILDKCTSETLPSSSPPPIADSLELADLIRSSAIPAAAALKALRRRLGHGNPNVQLLAIQVLDVCVKNGGDGFLSHVGARDTADDVASMARSTMTNQHVKTALLAHFQNWALAFAAVPALSGSELVGQYRRLRYEGVQFPPRDVSATAAMVDSMSAPEWKDSDVCERCRTSFSFTNRKHHCRNCGGVYDAQCSSKKRLLPHFGITAEAVRVCDGCDKKMAIRQTPRRNSIGGDLRGGRDVTSTGVNRSSTFSGGPTPSSRRHAYSNSVAPSSQRKQEDDDLAKAIALSLQDSGSSSPSHHRPGYAPSQKSTNTFTSTTATISTKHKEDEEDPDLAAAIAASLKDLEAQQPLSQWTNPHPSTTSPSAPKRPPLPTYDLAPHELDAFLTFSNGIEKILSTSPNNTTSTALMASKYGEMHDRAYAARPQLLRGLADAERKLELLQEMNDKVGQGVRMYDQLLADQLAFRTRNTMSARPYSMYAGQPPVADWAPQRHISTPSYSSAQPTFQQPPYGTVAGPMNYAAHPGAVQAPPQHLYQPPPGQPIQLGQPIDGLRSAPPPQQTFAPVSAPPASSYIAHPSALCATSPSAPLQSPPLASSTPLPPIGGQDQAYGTWSSHPSHHAPPSSVIPPQPPFQQHQSSSQSTFPNPAPPDPSQEDKWTEPMNSYYTQHPSAPPMSPSQVSTLQLQPPFHPNQAVQPDTTTSTTPIYASVPPPQTLPLAPAPAPTAPLSTNYSVPYSHYTIHSFPNVPSSEILHSTADRNHVTTYGHESSSRREQEEVMVAPLIEL